MLPLSSQRKQWALILLLMVAAFAVRLGVRIGFGEEYFWTNSYSAYYELAQSLLHGNGLCFEGGPCAWWPPLYPLFLAVTALGGHHYLLIVIPQALMGTGTALCAFLIGKEIFNPRVGLIACFITAFYPYYAKHDTTLQETGMLTFVVALSAVLLLRARRLDTDAAWFFAGFCLGAILLTRASLAPAVLLAFVWVALIGVKGTFVQRLREGGFVVLALSLTVGPWLIRTNRLIGAPVLSSQSGRALWIGNNAQTFSHYPNESIDLSTAAAYESMTSADRDELARASVSEMGASHWYSRRALAFMRANLRTTINGAVRKLGAGFSWTANPVQGRFAETVYFLSYVPVAILGTAGMIMAWQRCETLLIVAFFASFIAVTAVFWAHTSHRSYLDVYFIVFAASVTEHFRVPHSNKVKPK